jgi:hypothetical protein
MSPMPDADGSLEAASQAAMGPPDNEPMRLFQQISSIACDAELRILPDHDKSLLERLEVLHGRFCRLAGTGQLGAPMDSECHDALVNDLAIQIRNPAHRSVNVLACKVMLDLWVPGWETKRPALAREVIDKLPPHDDAPWAAMPIWRPLWQ